MFQHFYQSFWQHPLLLWIFPVLFLLRVRPHGGFFLNTVLLIGSLSILDPLMTGPVTNWLDLRGGAAQALMVVFVILGDARFFFLVMHYLREPFGPEAAAKETSHMPTTHPEGATTGRTFWSRETALALGLSLIVPILQALLIELFPSYFETARYTYLVYEVLFFGLAFAFYQWVVKASAASETRTWLLELCKYVMTYYFLWALADVVILLGLDVGYLLRVVPNVLYYGLFAPFVYLRAPRHMKREGIPELRFA